MRIKNFIIFILFLLASAAGVYYEKDVINFYNQFSNKLNQQIETFKQTDVGQTISEISKQILTPPPLRIGGSSGSDALVKSKIIEETNLQRQLNNLPALAENEILDEMAAAKANDMFLKQYFEHVSPSGVGPGELAKNYGYEYILVGENLILGNFQSEKEIVENWMGSPAHKENILNTRFTEIGIAIIKGTFNGESVWISVQEFGLPLSVCPGPSAELEESVDSMKSQLQVLSEQISAKRSQIDKTNISDPAYSQMLSDYNQSVIQYNKLASEVRSIVEEYNRQVNIFNKCAQGR